MQYLCLIYTDPTQGPQTPEAMAAAMPAWMEFTAATQAAGIFVAGEALQPVSTATTVRKRDSGTSHTDGPFAETKENLGGYYLLDCENLDDALSWAAKIPAADYGSIEVRPVMDLG